MIKGRARFDGIALGEMTVSFFGPSVSLVAKAAFVNSETGLTHGSTTHERWSPEALEKLSELRALLEREIARVHFTDLHADDVARTAAEGGTTRAHGLAEHLAGDAPPL
jgi:hypothetical protein